MSHSHSAEGIPLSGRYAPQPNDPYFRVQWYAERRNAEGKQTGPDLNVRAAWPVSQGKGVLVAVADDGVDLAHFDLRKATEDAPHFNFATQQPDGSPYGASWYHGVSVAGLIAAELNNKVGMVGIAPEVMLASWVIYTTNGLLAAEDQLRQMYEYRLDEVDVQNHSWGWSVATLGGPGALEQSGIAKAIEMGRGGKGIVMVRPAGNLRLSGGNANDDAYVNDPRVIAVAGVDFNGRAAAYSEPGAPILVAAPSHGPGQNGLFTTDLSGEAGINQIRFFGDPTLWDYRFDGQGFAGTSAAVAEISGVVSLILGANPSLSYRDVQQVLIHSSRHFDLGDPGLRRNGAGLLVSHNVGFGVPDAGHAVALAQGWPTRPSPVLVTKTSEEPKPIPDAGLQLLVTGDDVPAALGDIAVLPALGAHADVPLGPVPMVHIGLATNAIGVDLTGKAALILRGEASFAEKIERAADAGALFAVVYNSSESSEGCPGGDQLCLMGSTDFSSIPAVFIGHSDGIALRDFIATNSSARVQLELHGTEYQFDVSESLSLEHVAVRLKTDHTLRGDVRITIVSPSGTRSVLQQYGADASPGPTDWTYYSVHHFYESSAGVWKLTVADEHKGATGTVRHASLILQGVPLVDSDHDGLEDAWELQFFDTLAAAHPSDDLDADGYSNVQEFVLDTDPAKIEITFELGLAVWNSQLLRVGWPGVAGAEYEVLAGTDVNALVPVGTVSGVFPITEWFTPVTGQQFFVVRRK